MNNSIKSAQGFTLAELLIALAILGVIATFTIPKILTTQQNSKYNAMAKEVASSFAGAYRLYSQSNTVTTATKVTDLTPYLNYVSVDTSSTADDHYTWPSQSCGNGNYTCLKLHNGGIIWWQTNDNFGGTNSASDQIYINFDPDAGIQSSGSGVQFRLYWGGRLTSAQQAGEAATADPSWFQW